MKRERPILVLDSNYLGHAARYTMGDLSYGDVPSGIVFGFLTRILSLAQFFSSNRLVFAWDSRSSKRRKVYPTYKHKRRKLSEKDLKVLMLVLEQFTNLRRKVLPAIGFSNVFVQKGYEADDIMAGIVRDNMLSEIVIVSGDEDLYQLLYPNVRMWNPKTKKMVTQHLFEKRFGVSITQWPTVKAIAGCASDNVEGIKGVGIKTAVKSLRQELSDKTKAFGNINSKAGRKIVTRNMGLVKLPLPKTKNCRLKPDQFSLEGLIEVSQEYGLASFLTQDRLREWKNMMRGRFKRRSTQ